MYSISLGFFAGALHVVSGPDHLTAVAPLNIKPSLPGFAYGLLWGLGHSAGVCVIGLLFCFFRESDVMHQISMGSEKLVGIGLVYLGIKGIQMLCKPGMLQEQSTHSQGSRKGLALGFGVLHGGAGAHHLIGLLPLLSLGESTQILLYIFAYCSGTVIAMCGFSHLFHRFTNHLITRNKSNFKKMMIASSVSSLMIGSIWLIY